MHCMQGLDIYEEARTLVNSMGLAHCSPEVKQQKNKGETVETNEIGFTTNFSGMSCAEIAQAMSCDAENQAPLIHMLCDFLQEQITHNDRTRPLESYVSSFEGRCCRFSVAYYIKRIAKYSGGSPCCLVAALLYLERICRRRPGLRLTSHTLQRLLLVVTMAATKYLEDVSCPNTRWAEIGGLSLREVNALELEFLTAIDFDLAVHPDDYAGCVSKLRAFQGARQAAEACCVDGDDDAARRGPSDARAISPAEGTLSKAEAATVATLAPAAAKTGVEFSPAPRGPRTPESIGRLN